MHKSIYIGFDPREADAFAVARSSAIRYMVKPIPVYGIVLDEMRERGLYWRPTSRRDGQLWDNISEAPMSTEFAISRFLVPHLAKRGWALFVDADMLFRGNVDRIFECADPSKAVMVVKHNFDPPEGVKMDGQAQTRYARKNWSSVCLWNVGHPANDALTVEMINTVPGRDLHAFKWLSDDLIGELDASWNYLVGHTPLGVNPSIVHYTDGTPSMAGYEHSEYSEEWKRELARWASGSKISKPTRRANV